MPESDRVKLVDSWPLCDPEHIEPMVDVFLTQLQKSLETHPEQQGTNSNQGVGGSSSSTATNTIADVTYDPRYATPWGSRLVRRGLRNSARQ